MEQSNVHQKRVVQIKNLEEQATSKAEGETYKVLYCMLTGIRVAVSYKAMGVRSLTSADFSQVQKFTFQDNDTITPALNYDFRFMIMHHKFFVGFETNSISIKQIILFPSQVN